MALTTTTMGVRDQAVSTYSWRTSCCRPIPIRRTPTSLPKWSSKTMLLLPRIRKEVQLKRLFSLLKKRRRIRRSILMMGLSQLLS